MSVPSILPSSTKESLIAPYERSRDDRGATYAVSDLHVRGSHVIRVIAFDSGRGCGPVARLLYSHPFSSLQLHVHEPMHCVHYGP
jgi:hypothetical protein